jgi:hypothetical protein
MPFQAPQNPADKALLEGKNSWFGNYVNALTAKNIH